MLGEPDEIPHGDCTIKILSWHCRILTPVGFDRLGPPRVHSKRRMVGVFCDRAITQCEASMPPLAQASATIASVLILCTVVAISGLPLQTDSHPLESIRPIMGPSAVVPSNTGDPPSLRSIASPISVGMGSYPMVVDSVTDTIYVVNAGSDTISVITYSTSWSLTATLSVPAYPSSFLVDDQDHELLIGSYNPMGPANAPLAGTITAISTTTDTTLGSVQIGGLPFSMAFSPHMNELFVAKYYSGNVSVLSVNPLRLLATINVTTSYGLLYDPLDGLVFDASGELNGSVLAIDPVTNAIVSSVKLGSTPESLLLNPWNGLLYVPCGVYTPNYYPSIENATYVINTSAEVPVAIAPLPAQPRLVALDTSNGDVIVGTSRFTNQRQFFDGNLTVVSDTGNTVSANLPINAYFYGLVSDNVTGALYLLDGGNLTVLNATSIAPAYTVGLNVSAVLLAVDPTRGALFVGYPTYVIGTTGEVYVYQAPSPAAITTASVGGTFPLVVVVSPSIVVGAVVASVYAVFRKHRKP